MDLHCNMHDKWLFQVPWVAETWQNFDPAKHGPPKSRVQVKDEIEKQTKIAHIYVKRGESIEFGQVKESSYNPTGQHDTAIRHNFYCSDKQDAQYVNEEGVEFLGSFETPLEGKGCDRRVLVRETVFFGETELLVRTRQDGKEEWNCQTFDFLR